MTIELGTLNPTKREVVDEAKAREELVPTWTTLLQEKLAKGDSPVLCHKIDLSGKSYTPPAAKIIATFLTSTEHFQPCIASGIKTANLNDIIASQPEKEALEVLTTISDAFKESRLEEVDLSDNAMGSKGVTACKTVLSGEAVVDTLKHLKLCNNGLSQYTMDEVADLLTEGESKCIAKNLKTIHFFNNMSDDEGCESFRKIISCAENLTDVRFSGTRAKAKGSPHITSGLNELAKEGKLKNIVRLDLADNSFGDCYEDLANALRSCTNLEYLDIHDCCLGDDGIIAVCEALIQAKAPLKFLSLSGNDIGEESFEGGKSVAKLIGTINDTIVSFNASENELKSPGIRSIARAFKSGTVEEIRLNQNECGSVGAEELMKMALRLPSLKVIEADANGFLPDIVDGLQEAFGDKLAEMEDNVDDEDYDDDLDADDLKDEPDTDSDEDEAEDPDAEVDALATQLSQL